jgi:hypothetical protein
VVHTYNPSYSGGRDQEDHSLKPVQANSSWDPISKESISKKGWWSGSRSRPWVQAPVLPKKIYINWSCYCLECFGLQMVDPVIDRWLNYEGSDLANGLIPYGFIIWWNYWEVDPVGESRSQEMCPAKYILSMAPSSLSLLSGWHKMSSFVLPNALATRLFCLTTGPQQWSKLTIDWNCEPK